MQGSCQTGIARFLESNASILCLHRGNVPFPWAARRSRRDDGRKSSSPEIRLQVEYGGRLRRLPQFGTPAAEREGRFLDDAIDSERVELAWYSAWYPQLGDFGQTFEADLLVDLPTGWTLVGLGEPSSPTQRGSRTQVRWSAEAVTDLVLIASPAFEVVRVQQDDGGVEIYSSRLSHPRFPQFPQPRRRRPWEPFCRT